jgi:DNA modification methylase
MPPAPGQNRLNDLSNREWIRETKSFWWSQPEGAGHWTAEDVADLAEWLRETRGAEQAEAMLEQALASHMLSVAPPRGMLKSRHPATFSERDIERLIRFFTKAGETVLDPFLGSGSTLVACQQCGRRGLGIELIPQWAAIARERVGGPTDAAGPVANDATPAAQSVDPVDAASSRVGEGARPEAAPTEPGKGQTVIEGDALTELRKLGEASVDFVVTSPPYWSILDKKGPKVAAEREGKGLPTKYSESEGDLGNIADYGEFLDRLGEVFGECGRVLRPGKYLAVVVSDFRHGPQFVLYHADLASRIEAVGLALKGITVLLQDSKNLYPFGLGNAFVSNVHHQYILIHQKPK